MKNNNKKTIGIVISEALLVRNILRSGTLEILKQRGYKIVIFLYCKQVPDYFNDEFGDKNVTVVPIAHLEISRIHRLLIRFTHYYHWNKTMKRFLKYSRHYINKPWIANYTYLAFLRLVSLFGFILIPVTRLAEYYVFPEKSKEVENALDQYPVDLLFSSSITGKADNIFLKAAKRRKIVTVSMSKSWDNMTKMFLRFAPDHVLVQNELLRESAKKLQHFKDNQIHVVGFCQFDWYSRPEIIRSREEHCKKMGLDPNKKIIFFASQGIWFQKDYTVADKIYDWVKKDEFNEPCQLLVRPHFTNVKNTPIARFKDKEDVVYDDSFKVSYDFFDNWDPKVPEIVDFANTLYHSDVLVVILSTIALDAACYDKPVINALFGSIYKNGKDITPYMNSTDHYTWVLDTKGTAVANNEGELKDWINKFLKDPSIKEKERETLRKELCYKVDGKSSERIADALESILNKV